MRCCVPFCRSTTINAAGANEITFHNFPLDAAVCMKWLRALGKHDQSFKESVVCSQHFLDEEFCNIEGGQRQVRPGVIPSTVKLCMICLDTDRNLVSLSKYNLEATYERMTGHSIRREGNLKQTLCKECAQRMINFDRFRSKSLRARSAMMALVNMHETVTMRHIKQLKYIKELVQSDIVRIDFAPDHCNLHIKEYDYEDVQTDPANIMLPDASDAIKSEDYECLLDGSGIDLNSKETKDDIEHLNVENQECINNMLDASISLDTKLMDEALSKELGLVESIKSECSVSSDDAYNGHNDDTESHLDMGGDSCADYPDTSVNMLPTQIYEMVLEKKSTIDCGTENLKTRVPVNETEFKFVEKDTDKLQVNSLNAFSQTLNKQNWRQEYFCEHCEYKCSKRDNVIKHLKNHTNEELNFSCSSCDNTFKSKASLASHMRIHTAEKPFSCNLCEYACRDKRNLVSHMRIHTAEKPFSCNLCEYACRDKRNLVSHMRIHTGKKPFSCNLCEYACKHKGSLVSHMRIHTGEKPFSCNLCEYASRDKRNLVSHMRIHTGKKPFSCNLCEYACKHKLSLVSHMRIHTGEKPFSCNLCEYACRDKRILVSHMKIHTGKKPFSCNLCEYACKRKGNLVRHMRIHTDEKPFSCNLCEYAGRDKRHLVSHMRIHTGEKPFSCNLCEYAGRDKRHLVSHMRIHTGEKLFSCYLCEYACRKKGDLLRHKNLHQ